MDDSQVNILVQTFPSLNLPSTLCIPVSRTRRIQDVQSIIFSHLPSASHPHCILTTTSNHHLLSSTNAAEPVSTLLPHDGTPFLPLRLSLPLVGGKGGFGSQLRAAGGRMSSKRKRRDQIENSGSNRNLDGRRLRTVNEAKALAEYLAVKPEMDKKEKEAKKKRWEQIVDLAEEKAREIRSGNKGKVNGEWVESKEEASERTRDATRRAMVEGTWTDVKFERGESSRSGSGSGSQEEEAQSSSEGTTPPDADAKDLKAGAKGKQKAVEYFGFDEDDEFMSDDEEEEHESKAEK
jgi:Silencing defective 2 N-terminal ubiquitin domain